jgi:hypothetical protein
MGQTESPKMLFLGNHRSSFCLGLLCNHSEIAVAVYYNVYLELHKNRSVVIFLETELIFV